MEGIFITARLKSTRLPRKVLLNVLGKTVLKYQLDRLKANTNIKLILCTSTNSQDDELIDFAIKEKIEYFRGSEDDVINRYYNACTKFGIEKFYIIYGDEPFTDIELLYRTLSQIDTRKRIWIDNSDFTDGTFGYGMSFKAIEYAEKNKTKLHNEVWGRMLSEMDIEIIKNINECLEISKSVRLTIDYPEDLTVFTKIIENIGERSDTISIKELQNLYNQLKLYEINGQKINEYNKRIQKQGYLNT
jgi:spore coat polysaccharide biosynthesis protein SpsF